MTVNEAIARADAVYPQEEQDGVVYEWLNELEARICSELLFKESNEITESSGEYELSAPKAYCELYPLYIMMKRELLLGDSQRYEFYEKVFSAAYAEYASYTVRSGVRTDAVYIKTV